MKKSMMIAALMFVITPAFALSDSGAVKLFGVQPMTQIEAQGKDYDGGFGLGAGLEYLRKINDKVSLGVEIDRLASSAKGSDVILNGIHTTVSSSILAILAMARLDLTPKEKLNIYLSGGLGLGIVSLYGQGTPLAGFKWKNGGSDTRTLVNDSSAALAVTLRAGADVPITEHLVLGSELGFIRTSDVSHGLTDQGKALLGDVKINGPEMNFIIGTSLSYRY